MIVFGTRPEAIKLCPLVIELKKYKDVFETVTCVTAQHREMLDQILDIFGITPDYDLDLMQENQTLFDITSGALIGLGNVIDREKPDMLIVQGDTTTTFTASLAAFYCHVQVGHVEAGLRTNNKYSPFPEEINRRLTGSIADLHFAATEKNKLNLLREGIKSDKISVTGNTVIDALMWVRNKLARAKTEFDELSDINFKKKIILVTGHRRENFGKDFENICCALKKIALKNDYLEIVYPVHFNPNVRKTVFSTLDKIDNIKLIEPLNYEPFVYLMNKSFFIISDSGGIQEEAPSLGKPLLVTRKVTERPEAVDAGAVKLVGTDKDVIFNEAEKLLNDRSAYERMSKIRNPYGDGTACRKIVDILLAGDS